MADEKKRVGVVVSSGSPQSSEANFNFTDFQNQFYSEGQGSLSNGDNVDGYHTAYQCRKTSVVAGVSADELLTQHRKSIAQISRQGNPDSGVAGTIAADLMGVTLSRRHQQSVEEYNEEHCEKVYASMEGYQFEGTS